jgi:dolichol-phosphate mannosyltransferase
MKHIILLPTYNEAENVERIISRIMTEAPSLYVKVIDDNSPDGTSDIVKKLMDKYSKLSLLCRSGKEGLGKAYTHGFREVIKDPEATHLFMMDADMSHDPKYLEEMVSQSGQYDLVIGSRYTKGGGTSGWETWRKLLSFLGNFYARSVTRMPVKDMTGGFNCIKIERLKLVDLDSVSSSGYAFIMELKYNLYKKGASIKEIPITFVNRYGGESKISNNIISEGIMAPWKMIWKQKKK